MYTFLISANVIKIYSWAANQNITMISEGSCDTEDWSNDADNSALPSQEYDANDIKMTFKMYTKIK